MKQTEASGHNMIVKNRIRSEETDTIGAYLNELKQHPQLKHPEVVDLFKTYAEGGPQATKARKKLIESNLRLVISIAKKHKGHNIPLEDLIQEGNIGLLKAIERFDWKKGFRFSTYATWWIKQAIGQHVLKRKRMIRLPAHAAGVQRKLLQAAEEFKEMTGVDPTQEELFELVDASEAVVKATMASGNHVVSLDQPYGGAQDQNDPKSMGEYIEDMDHKSDPFYNVSSKELMGIVRSVLSNLTEKESAILRLRFGLFDDSPESRLEYRATQTDIQSVRSGQTLT